MAPFYPKSIIMEKPFLTDQELREKTGSLLKSADSEELYFADITYVEEFKKLKSPKGRVLKMAKKEHVDSFFKEGILQLGTFNYYKKKENPEIGDSSEGDYIVVGRHPGVTWIFQMIGGLNNYVFCCYDGEPEPKVIERFGYNDCFEITDLEGFSNAIKKSLNAVKSFKSKCVYKKDKVLIGNLPIDQDFRAVVTEVKLGMDNEAKYFMKFPIYEHQNEFRFIWQMQSNEEVEDPLLIHCPEAIEYCRRHPVSFNKTENNAPPPNEVVQLSDITEDLLNSLPDNIGDYMKRVLQADNFVVIEYSKRALMMRYLTKKQFPDETLKENLLFESVAPNIEIAVMQMQRILEINKKKVKEIEEKFTPDNS